MAWFRNIFRNTSMPTRINQALISQCVQGYPLPVVMGCGKVQQSLLWLDGFRAYTISGQTGGNKGLGGGKGGNEYDYTANVIAALCDGSSGITGIRDVWSGNTWLTNGGAQESYTIASGTTYTPAFASLMVVDHGVSTLVAVSGSHNDVGAGAPTVLSGSIAVPFSAVPFGTSLTTGEYSVDPTTGAYHFATVDIGKTVTVYYSFSLKTNQQQIRAIIPIGQSVTLGTNITQGEGSFYKNISVTYYTSGSDLSNNGVALTQIPTGSGPTVTGTYNVNGSLPAVYNFAVGDVGKEVLITYQIDVSKNILTNTPTALNFMLMGGSLLQDPWSLLESSFPYASLGYSGKALICYDPMDLGVGGNVQQNTFEVLTADGWGGGIVDCNPVQCILQVVTHPVWGLGAGKVPFPLSAIDADSSGTWGNPTNQALVIQPPKVFKRTGGVVVTTNTASEWFAANGFFISPVLDRQDTAASAIGRWLEAGQCAAFMSEGLWKLRPYGDTTVTGNGSTWTAPSAYAFNLTDDDFIVAAENQDPVKMSSTPWMDAPTKVQISWNNRANQYAPEITPEGDEAAINRYGERLEDPQAYEFITTLPAAAFAGSMRVKRFAYIRKTFTWKLRFKYDHLEPGDVGTITTSSSWASAISNQNLNVVTVPVRIIKIVDNPDGTLDVTAENYLQSINTPTVYPKATGTPVVAINPMAYPGDTTAVLFEAPSRLTGYAGNQIWIGAAGQVADWGGCNILVSMNGATYKNGGTIRAGARIGQLAAAYGTGADPDTTDSLVVNLLPLVGALEAGTTADADQDNTLCYVDGELLSYSACAVSGRNQYTMDTYIRRGQMGSAISAHAIGADFLRLDDTVYHLTYDPSWYGKTVYIKLQSFNAFGNSLQDESTLTAVAFTVPGANPGAFDATTGAAYNLGGVGASDIIQGIVNNGGLPPGTYGGTPYPVLTLSPGNQFGNTSVTFTAYLNGVLTTAVTFSLGGGSLGSLSGSTWNPPGTVPPHGGAGVICQLTANPTVQATAAISW